MYCRWGQRYAEVAGVSQTFLCRNRVHRPLLRVFSGLGLEYVFYVKAIIDKDRNDVVTKPVSC